jgi:hypothetical protein
MTEHQDILASLDARLSVIEAILLAHKVLWTDPDSQIGMAFRDLLNIRGMVAMSGEVIGNQRDQILALSDVMAMMLGRQIEHDRRAIHEYADIHALAELAHAMAPSQIATQAAEARSLLQEEARAQLVELEAHAIAARKLLRIAKMDAQLEVTDEATIARGIVGEAQAQARQELERATEDT